MRITINKLDNGCFLITSEAIVTEQNSKLLNKLKMRIITSGIIKGNIKNPAQITAVGDNMQIEFTPKSTDFSVGDVCDWFKTFKDVEVIKSFDNVESKTIFLEQSTSPLEPQTPKLKTPELPSMLHIAQVHTATKICIQELGEGRFIVESIDIVTPENLTNLEKLRAKLANIAIKESCNILNISEQPELGKPISVVFSPNNAIDVDSIMIWFRAKPGLEVVNAQSTFIRDFRSMSSDLISTATAITSENKAAAKKFIEDMLQILQHNAKSLNIDSSKATQLFIRSQEKAIRHLLIAIHFELKDNPIKICGRKLTQNNFSAAILILAQYNIEKKIEDQTKYVIAKSYVKNAHLFSALLIMFVALAAYISGYKEDQKVGLAVQLSALFWLLSSPGVVYNNKRLCDEIINDFNGKIPVMSRENFMLTVAPLFVKKHNFKNDLPNEKDAARIDQMCTDVRQKLQTFKNKVEGLGLRTRNKNKT